MKDIKLENEHLILKEGDFDLVDGRDRVQQQVIVGLKIFRGDWYLDYRKGIDYINGLKAYPNILRTEIKEAIEEVLDVDNVLDYTFKRNGRNYNVSAKVLVNNEEFYISGEYTL